MVKNKIRSLLLFLSAFFCLSAVSYAGMGMKPETPRDPYLDDLETRMKSEYLKVKDELSAFGITHADVDCQIRVDDRFFSATTSLKITIPSKNKRFPLMIFEDFEIERIDMTSTALVASGNASQPATTTVIGTDQTNIFTNLKYERVIPPLNKEADDYMIKNKKKYEEIHFFDGERLPRFPHLIWIDLPKDMPDSPANNALLTVTYSGKLDHMDQHPFTKFQVFLNGGDFWIPSLFDKKPTFRLKIKIDRPWHIFAQGKLIGEKIDEKSAYYEYTTSIPQAEPVIIAGDYRVDKEKFKGIDLYGFYFSGNEGGKAVMEKSKEYLEFFSDLIGRYPFESFAIIESPAPVGYGYPSFTAIGTLVMQMHFTEPFALGHEILHNWWGNYVETPSYKGNWCEALTTYMCNYHYVEVTEGNIAALNERRRNLENLSIYLGGKDEFPLKDFEYNKGNIDQVVGYTKGFYLLHEMRRLIGDKPFFQAIRNFYVKYGAREATWQNLLEEFKVASGDKTFKLDKVFSDFLNELGIPKIEIHSVILHKDEDKDLKYSITGEITIDGNFLNIHDFPYVVYFSEGTKAGKIDLIGKSTKLELSYDEMPRGITFDPGFDVYRYIPEIDRALNLNRFYDKAPISVLVPKNDDVYKELAESVKINEENAKVITFADMKLDELDDMDILAFVSADNVVDFSGFMKRFQIKLPEGFEFQKERISAGGNQYDGADNAVLLTLHNPSEKERTITILYATGKDELKKARGRLRFYGDYGWVVFKDVKVQDKGHFPPENISLTERFKNMIVCDGGVCETIEIPQ